MKAFSPDFKSLYRVLWVSFLLYHSNSLGIRFCWYCMLVPRFLLEFILLLLELRICLCVCVFQVVCHSAGFVAWYCRQCVAFCICYHNVRIREPYCFAQRHIILWNNKSNNNAIWGCTFLFRYRMLHMSLTSYTVNAMRCFYHGRVYCTQIVLNMFNKIEDYEMVTKKHTHTLTHSKAVFSAWKVFNACVY